LVILAEIELINPIAVLEELKKSARWYKEFWIIRNAHNDWSNISEMKALNLNRNRKRLFILCHKH